MKSYYLFAIVLILYALATVRIRIPEDFHVTGVYAFVSKMAYPLYLLGEKIKRFLQDKKFGTFLLFLDRSERDMLKTMEPCKNAITEQQKRKFQNTCEILVLVIAVGLLSVVVGMNRPEGNLVEGDKIKRNEKGGYTKDASLQISTEAGLSQDMTISIMEQKYSDEELEQLALEILPILMDTVRGNNESLDVVKEPLRCVSSIEGYPFNISYESGNNDVLTEDGQPVFDAIPKEGIDVSFEMILELDEFTKIIPTQIRVERRELSEAEAFEKNWKEAFEKQDEDTKTGEYLELPKEVNGVSVNYDEKKTDYGCYLLILAAVLPFLICYDKRSKLQKEVQNREKELLEDYAEVVSKLTLLTGAGMTIRSAFKRMVLDYKKSLDSGRRKRFVYEEMWITVREMESGISEKEAYERFGQRLRIKQYLKLSALISQNLRKGSKGLISGMQKETQLAFQEKKALTLVKSEKAGTKVLAPMAMMLALVIVMIMLPAFMKMNF